MTNEEIIKRLESIASAELVCDGLKVGAITKECFESIQETVRLAISALERGRWISVEETPPPIASAVIVAGKMKYRFEAEYTTFVDVAIYTLEERFETFNDWYEGQDEFFITHWMPLPEPPKEET